MCVWDCDDSFQNKKDKSKVNKDQNKPPPEIAALRELQSGVYKTEFCSMKHLAAVWTEGSTVMPYAAKQ